MLAARNNQMPIWFIRTESRNVALCSMLLRPCSIWILIKSTYQLNHKKTRQITPIRPFLLGKQLFLSIIICWHSMWIMPLCIIRLVKIYKKYISCCCCLWRVNVIHMSFWIQGLCPRYHIYIYSFSVGRHINTKSKIIWIAPFPKCPIEGMG